MQDKKLDKIKIRLEKLQTEIIGESEFIINLNKSIEKISVSNARVLISGPIGSGKKLIPMGEETLVFEHFLNKKILEKIFNSKIKWDTN